MVKSKEVVEGVIFEPRAEWSGKLCGDSDEKPLDVVEKVDDLSTVKVQDSSK